MNKKIYHGVITSLSLIGAGVFLLMKNLHKLPAEIPEYFFTWKMLLVFLGVFSLLHLRVVSGILLLGLGVYFLLPEVFGVAQENIFVYWPIFLILCGIGVFFASFCYQKGRRQQRCRLPISQPNSANYVVETVVFGSVNKKIASFDFKGGRLKTIFGGIEIDLTSCELNKELNLLQVGIVFGGISLKVPKEWSVNLHVLPVLGGVEDEYHKYEAFIDPTAQFYIKGIVVFGGLEIIRA